MEMFTGPIAGLAYMIYDETNPIVLLIAPPVY